MIATLSLSCIVFSTPKFIEIHWPRFPKWGGKAFLQFTLSLVRHRTVLRRIEITTEYGNNRLKQAFPRLAAERLLRMPIRVDSRRSNATS